MSRKILRKDWSTYTDGDFQLVNNPWNQGNLVNGEDYTQTVTFDTRHITRGVVFAWDWPAVGHVVAYPEIIAGFKPWGQTGTDSLSTRLDALATLDVDIDYDIFGDRGQFNVAFDLWLSDRASAGPGHITTELMIWTHDGDLTPAGRKIGSYRDGDFRAEIWVANHFGDDSGDNTNASWRYIAVRAKDEIRADTIDIAAIIADLVERGLVDGHDYLNGYEFGAEVIGGKGEMRLHHISHEFATIAGGASETGDIADGLENADFQF